jgi:hypothetical protein
MTRTILLLRDDGKIAAAMFVNSRNSVTEPQQPGSECECLPCRGVAKINSNGTRSGRHPWVLSKWWPMIILLQKQQSQNTEPVMKKRKNGRLLSDQEIKHDNWTK